MAAACVAAVATLGTSACVAMPEERSGAKAAWKPPAPEKFLPTYDEISSQAANKLDTGQIAQVQSGPLLLTSQAAYKVRGARIAAGEPKVENAPPKRSDQQVYLPKFDDYPAWFVDSSKVSGSEGSGGNTVLGLNMRVDAGTDWKRITTVTLDEGVEVPEIATEDDGSAAVLTEEDSEKLTRPDNAIAAAYAGYLQGGKDAPHAAAFAEHETTTDWLELFDEEAKTARQGGGTMERAVDDVVLRSLATTEGGALVVFSLQETADLQLGDRSIDLDEVNPIRFYTGKRKATDHMKATYAWQGAAYVPPEGEDGDKVTLLGVQRNLTSAEVR